MRIRSDISRTVRSAGLFFAALIGARIINFLFFLLLARWLSVADFGLLSYAVVLVTVVEIISDFGLSRLLLRDISRRPGVTERRLGLLAPLKALLCVLVYGAALTLVALGAAEPGLLLVFLALGVSVPVVGVAMLCEQVLHSRGRFDIAAGAHVSLAVAQLGGGALAHALGGGVMAMAGVVALANVVYLLVILAGLQRCGVRLAPGIDPGRWRRALARSAPFALVGILIVVMLRVEFFVLGQVADAAALGRYGAAARVFEAALLAPLTFCAVLTPRFVALRNQSPDQATTLYAHAMRVMLSGALLSAVMGWLLADAIIALLLPAAYAFSADVLRILFVALPPLAVHLLNASVMLAVEPQSKPARLLGGLVVAQALVAVAGTALLAEVGAALAVAASAFLCAVVSSVAVRRWIIGPCALDRIALPALAGGLASAAAGLAAQGLGSVAAAAAAGAAMAAVGLAAALLRPLPPAPIPAIGLGPGRP